MEFFGDKYNPYGVQIKAEFENLYTQDSISFLRVVFFDETDNVDKLMSYKDSFAETKHVPALSSRSELKVLHQLIVMCQKKLAGYTRTFQGDVDIFR